MSQRDNEPNTSYWRRLADNAQLHKIWFGEAVQALHHAANVLDAAETVINERRPPSQQGAGEAVDNAPYKLSFTRGTGYTHPLPVGDGETPRTNAECDRAWDFGKQSVVPADFARTLELELQAATRVREGDREAFEVWLRTVCFQAPPDYCKDLAWEAWQARASITPAAPSGGREALLDLANRLNDDAQDKAMRPRTQRLMYEAADKLSAIAALSTVGAASKGEPTE